MVLADLLAAELGSPAPPPAAAPVTEEDEAARLAVTVAQLEHALPRGSGSSRPSASSPNGTGCGPGRRSTCSERGPVRRPAVIEIAETVVDSASNPLPLQRRKRGGGRLSPGPRRSQRAASDTWTA